MPPSSGTVPRLDELIKPFLLEGRSEWHTLLLLATIAVVVGVVLEAWEIFHDVREEIDHNRGITRTRPLTLSGEGIPVIEHRRTWMKTLGAVGWIFIVLGVAGEFEFDSMISDFDNGIRLIDDSLLKQARSESADSNISAALATEEAARADARTLREIDARLALEKQVKIQGPRWRLLDEAKPTLINDLKPYRGESTIILVCGSPNDRDEEKRRVVNTLWTIFQDKTVGWKPDLKYNEQCVGSFTIGVFFDPKSEDKTRDAASKLAEDLRVLPFTPARAIPNSFLATVALPKDTVGLIVGLHP
jgi:hypothetical protein